MSDTRPIARILWLIRAIVSYWDWVTKPRLPELLTAEFVEVFPPPLGTSTKINNPLCSYKFHPIDPSFEGRFSVWPQTLRWPLTALTPHATDTSHSEVTNRCATCVRDQIPVAHVLSPRLLELVSYQVKSYVSTLMQTVHEWAPMSNLCDGHNSLEAVHALLHLLLGGDAHMSEPAIAGFDPVFFFHHTEVSTGSDEMFLTSSLSSLDRSFAGNVAGSKPRKASDSRQIW